MVCWRKYDGVGNSSLMTGDGSEESFFILIHLQLVSPRHIQLGANGRDGAFFVF